MRTVCIIHTFLFLFFYHTISLKQTLGFLHIFQNKPHYFCMIIWMKESNNFQKGKVQPDGVAQILLVFCFLFVFWGFFCQLQPDITCKNVAYKKCVQFHRGVNWFFLIPSSQYTFFISSSIFYFSLSNTYGRMNFQSESCLVIAYSTHFQPMEI